MLHIEMDEQLLKFLFVPKITEYLYNGSQKSWNIY